MTAKISKEMFYAVVASVDDNHVGFERDVIRYGYICRLKLLIILLYICQNRFAKYIKERIKDDHSITDEDMKRCHFVARQYRPCSIGVYLRVSRFGDIQPFGNGQWKQRQICRTTVRI